MSASLQQLITQHTFLNTEVQKLLYEKVLVENQQSILEKKIKEDKNWESQQKQRQFFLEKLQEYLQQQNVLAFNQMLSAFVEDVLEKDKQIELELFTSYNLPALKIHAKNNGETESIMDGSGGSLANIVSTGLRIIAVARSPSRNFLLLDEADCWIKPERIELFAKVIGEISVKFNMQIVMISHHSAQYFQKYGRVIELKKKGGKIEAEIVSDTEHNNQNNYITKMRLQNLMSHDDTTIEFHPNITCIIGENDIGKSVIAAAFRAVSRASSDDGFIKHKKDFAGITIEGDNQWQIYWQRNKKTTQEHKQKVFYDLIENSTLIAREYNAHECPGFIAKKLNIEENNNIDVHLAHQKEPTFLIDSKTKPQEKAKILSLGKESLIVHKMMEKIKEKAKIIKEQLKENEAQYYTNSLILKNFEELSVLEQRVELLADIIEQIKEQNATVEKLSALCTNFEKSELIANIPALDVLPEYHLDNTSSLETVVNYYQLYKDMGQIQPLPVLEHNYQLQDTQTLSSVVKQLEKTQGIDKVQTLIPIDTNTYQLQNTQSLTHTVEQLNKLVNIDKVQTLTPIDTNNYQLQNTQSLTHTVEQLNKLINIDKVQTLTPIDTSNYSLQNSEKLFYIIEQIQNNTYNVAKLPVINTPEITETDKLKQLISEMEKNQVHVSSLNTKLENSKQWFALLEQEKQQLHEELKGLCPCCGNQATIEQLL